MPDQCVTTAQIEKILQFRGIAPRVACDLVAWAEEHGFSALLTAWAYMHVGPCNVAAFRSWCIRGELGFGHRY